MGADGSHEGDYEDIRAPGPARRHALPPGTVVGDCEILGLAGIGAMGVVYRACQRSLGRLLALKLIREDIARAPEYRERFLREARSAAAVDHPHIVSVYDAGEDAGRLYLTMQWVEGEDLSRMLARCGRLEPEAAVELTCQLAGALDAIHGAGLIHRDLKPANVVVREFDGAGHAYLTDFGLARLAETSVEITRTGQVLGTVGYLAPEQLGGGRPAPAADLYALGCVFFQLLTGHPPFERDNELALLMAHVNAPRPLPSAVLPALGTRYDRFTARAMAVAPEERFASGRELAAGLQSARAGLPVPLAQHREASAPDRGAWPAPARTGEPVDRPASPRRLLPAQPGPADPSTAAFGIGPAPARRRRHPVARGIALLLVALAVLAAALVVAPSLRNASPPSSSSSGGSGSSGGPAAARGSAAAGTGATAAASGGTGQNATTSTPAGPSAPQGPPSGAITSCGGDLMAGPDTSCPFAQNVEQAYDHSSGGAAQVSAFSPETGATYTLQCTDATPHVCTNSRGAAVYFTSGPPGQAPALPGGLKHCDPNISGSPQTSCPFAENVFVAYYHSYEAGATAPTMALTVYSPTTGLIYRLECASTATVSCAGPSGVFVSFPLQAVKVY